MKEIYLAGGCFWGAEKYLASIHGVAATQAGYANGKTQNPTYEQVCREGTDHAETVKVTYDEAVLPLPFLLSLFYDAIDPTTVDRQGGDTGRQYRTGIYYTSEADLPAIRASIGELAATLSRPVAIEVAPLENYWPAEEYHQKYLDKNPGGYCHIGPAQFARAAAARPPATDAKPLVDPAAYQKATDLQDKLTPEQYDVTQNAATEPPFKNEFWDHHQKGIYVDVTSGEPLFASSAKFDSGCGWPSFSAPIAPEVLAEKRDLSHGMVRTEVKSRVGDAHLGHVFDDGPKDAGGLRYCINSAALRFVPKAEMEREGYGHLLGLVK